MNERKKKLSFIIFSSLFLFLFQDINSRKLAFSVFIFNLLFNWVLSDIVSFYQFYNNDESSYERLKSSFIFSDFNDVSFFIIFDGSRKWSDKYCADKEKNREYQADLLLFWLNSSWFAIFYSFKFLFFKLDKYFLWVINFSRTSGNIWFLYGIYL